MVPEIRIRTVNSAPVHDDGEYVLYWMIAFRRWSWNFSLDRAVEWSRELGKPLVVLEALRIGYPWASDRPHAFVMEGMRDNLDSVTHVEAQGTGVHYYPYLERRKGGGKGLVEALAERAAIVVTDDFPCFFLPGMVAATAPRLPVRLEAVDSNGLLPMRATDRVFQRAYDFRRFLQKELPNHLDQAPAANPMTNLDLPLLPDRALLPVLDRWPAVAAGELEAPHLLVQELSIAHDVATAPLPGGGVEAQRRWRSFLDGDLRRYAEGRNDPDADSSSGLSPYLHFGHLSTHQVFAELAERQGWTPLSIGPTAKGQRQGWWGMSGPAEAFLDQIVTWRELGFNMASQSDDYDRFESLPVWAQRTIDDHRDDPRPWIYSEEELESASTHDEIWNAAQRQLLREGRMHNYLRMLWGKKIYEWSEHPEEALATMIQLNNKYALDGRDPNSYSGIFWCLGRYDRAWGPERPIFGKIRYMSSDNTRRKLALGAYLKCYAASESPPGNQARLF